MPSKRLGLILFPLLILSSAPAHAQRGAIVLPRNLGQLVDQSAVIIRGRVTSARVEPHPLHSTLWTVVVTLRVDETLKGKATGTFSFRQFIWDVRDRWDLAGYRAGQDLLLLMNALTSYGLSSPAGLEQGRFRILRDARGQETAVNGHGNAGLFANLEESHLTPRRIQLSPRLRAVVTASQAGPLLADDLRELILRLVEAK